MKLSKAQINLLLRLLKYGTVVLAGGDLRCNRVLMRLGLTTKCGYSSAELTASGKEKALSL